MSQKRSHYLYADEAQSVEEMAAALPWDHDFAARVSARATTLVDKVRDTKRKRGELESFLQQYGLNTEEGLALMTLAEALLRIPDAATANLLIKDKMKAAEWLGKQGGSKDLMVKAAGLGLSLTSKTLDSAAARLGEPVIRKAMVEAIRMLGRQFVLGRTIEEGMKNAGSYAKKGYRVSYDMLGEGARTYEDANRYFDGYRDALLKIAAAAGAANDDITRRSGLSVKLSALHPRYEFSQKQRCVPELANRLATLAALAAQHHLPLTIDAEEVDRLDLSLEIIETVLKDPALEGWNGFGVVVQAYQKQAPQIIDDLAHLAAQTGRMIQIRLVKGAYWDTEIKRAQIENHPDYPVFTRKANTDLCYLLCARKLMGRRDIFYPMLATHNAHTIAAILEMAGNDRTGFEFQRLHGMGETLHDRIIADESASVCVYAPCGSHEDLLPYLVRRLLENGASTSFVHQILDDRVPVADIVADPVANAVNHPVKRHPKIPLPAAIYGAERKNSAGLDIRADHIIMPHLDHMKKFMRGADHIAAPVIGGRPVQGKDTIPVYNPANPDDQLGRMVIAESYMIEDAFQTARRGFAAWSVVNADRRAQCLEKLADLMEEHYPVLMALCVREAGKTIADAVAEVREAVDFCRYYAMRGRADFATDGTAMPGPTGETNILTLHGRGVFVCISPWNFPLAIFTGQVVAALMAGNAVIAKPAEQTPLIAAKMASLILKAGIHPDAFCLMTGDGAIGAKIVSHPHVDGVAFTGSTDVARLINRTLAEKDAAIIPLIAETGGQNAMIVDSSALAEQVIDDVLASAFGSAGQRCSALRVLYLQSDIAPRVLEMLEGAMQERIVGDPFDLATDIGPVIDDDALAILTAHRQKMDDGAGRLIASVPVHPDVLAKGHFFAPVAYEIDNIAVLEREIFGPVLHVIRYESSALDRVIQEINQTGYGLTLGVHSRIATTANHISSAARVGNAYINRTMTGAVVGVQPFGGNGLSGTGPKAGGPHYLHRFATEKLVSTDTTRQGGNASLVTMDED